MNWKSTLMLSGIGVLMGLAAVFGLTRSLEGPLWLVIGVGCSLWIARRLVRPFLHGFWVGLVGGAAATVIQAVFYSTYLERNPGQAVSVQDLPWNLSPRAFVLAVAPVSGLMSGLMLGLLSWLSSKLIGKKHRVSSVEAGSRA